MPENEHEYDRPMNADEQARAASLTEAELRTIDECILSNITHHWRKTAKAVALTMGDIGDNLRLPDVFYSGRIKHLAAADRRQPQPHAAQRGAARTERKPLDASSAFRRGAPTGLAFESVGVDARHRY